MRKTPLSLRLVDEAGSIDDETIEVLISAEGDAVFVELAEEDGGRYVSIDLFPLLSAICARNGEGGIRTHEAV
jgi:hypothetical protein